MAITGGSANDPDPPVPAYRKGWEIEDFFREHGWSFQVGNASRFPATKEMLFSIHEQPHGVEKISKLVVAAVDPRDFIDRPGDLTAVVDYLNARLRFDGFELQRDGAEYRLVDFTGDPLAPGAEADDTYEFDVALTFAGEDRDYVRSVAQIIEAEAIRCFYDEDNEVELWAKNL